MKVQVFLGSALALAIAAESAVAEDLKHCQEATKDLRAEIHDSAIENFTLCIDTGDLSPARRAVAYMGRANAYLAIGELTRAKSDYEKAHYLDPTLSENFVNQGAELQSGGDLDQAIGFYGLAINLDPNSTAAFLNRGSAFLRAKQYDLALADYEQVLRIDPGLADAYSGIGNAEFFKGDFERAIDNYNTALRLDERLSFVNRPRGLAYFSIGQFAPAQADLERHLARSPQDKYAVLWLYVAEARAEGPGAREKLKERIGSYDPNSGVGLLVQLFLGDIEATKVAEIVEADGTGANPTFRAVAWFFAGQHELISGDKASARSLFEKVVESGIENVSIHARAELARL